MKETKSTLDELYEAVDKARKIESDCAYTVALTASCILEHSPEFFADRPYIVDSIRAFDEARKERLATIDAWSDYIINEPTTKEVDNG